MQWQFSTIGQVHTACKEKFGLPRQAGLVPELTAELEIFPPWDRDEAFTELAQFSHIWVISVFHQAVREEWQPTVRPPRLGGNTRVGVFASRSPYRPNPVALSAMRLLGISRSSGRLILSVAGNDLVDGTPLLDIKPYIPYADSIADATGGYTDSVPHRKLAVTFSKQADELCQKFQADGYTGLHKLIIALLQQDPRPAYQAERQAREYGIMLYDLNIRFAISDDQIIVTEIGRV